MTTTITTRTTTTTTTTTTAAAAATSATTSNYVKQGVRMEKLLKQEKKHPIIFRIKIKSRNIDANMRHLNCSQTEEVLLFFSSGVADRGNSCIAQLRTC